MIAVNFIPVERREAMLRRACIRTWCMVCASLAVALCITTGMSFLLQPDLGARIDADIAQLATRAQGARQSADEVRGRLQASTRLLQANRSVGVRANWGVLLALLSDTTGEEIVLTDMQLLTSRDSRALLSGPMSQAMAPRGARGDGHRIMLEVGGLGRSPIAVSQFALNLEKLPLFEQVKVSDTWREPIAEDQATAFRLMCVLDTEAEEPS